MANEIEYRIRQYNDQVVSPTLAQYRQKLTELEQRLTATSGLGQVPSEDLLQLQRDVRKQGNTIDELVARSEFDKGAGMRVKSIDDIPGPRTPQWYTIEVDFVNGDTAKVFNTAEINPEGPFVITQMQAYWRVTDDDSTHVDQNALGRVLPVSAYPILIQSLGSVAFSTVLAALTEVPEFSFEIEISGSGRFWTNNRITGAALYGWSQAMYTGIMGWVDPSDRLKIHVSPERTVPHDGSVEIVLHGFQILNPLRLSEILGYG